MITSWKIDKNIIIMNQLTCCEVEDGAVVEVAVDVWAAHHEPVGGVAHQARDLDAAMLGDSLKNLVSAVILRVLLDRAIARETAVHPGVRRNIVIFWWHCH